MNQIVLATGLLLRRIDDRAHVLLAASHYANQPEPLWNLPGGRQEPNELLKATAAREFLEETGVAVVVGPLAYVSESYDGETHILNATFAVVSSDDPAPQPHAGDHVVAVRWVRVEDLASRISVAVVREPLLAHLRCCLPQRYMGFQQAGITIEWPRGDDVIRRLETEL